MEAESHSSEDNDRLSYDPDRLPKATTASEEYMRALWVEMRRFNRNVRDVAKSIDKLEDTLSKMRINTSKASK